MDIKMFQSKIIDLRKHYEDITPTTLRETLEIVYPKLVLTRLERVFNNVPSVSEEIELYLADRLTLFLKENWTLINGTLLSYTALPNSEITDLLITIAVNVAQDKNTRGEQVSPIQILMPTVSLESLKPESYASLDTVVDPLEIKAILQTHILGYRGLYLLPIKLLTELNLSAERNPLYNPYFDCFIPHPSETATVNSEEFTRLIGHDSLTQALFDQKQTYENLASDTSSLLGQLKQLILNLGIHSASGLGEETNASGGAYPTIISFMHYYAQLEPCGLQVSEDIPTIDALSEGRMMGYVLVRPNPEETALYFINRYDENSPVKKITNDQQYLRYGLDLVTVDKASDIESLKPRLSTLHPTLIRIKGENNAYMLYGYTENQQWELTTLDAERIEAAKISFLDQKPSEEKRIIHLSLGRIPQTIYENIATYKAHYSQPLAIYLHQLPHTETEHLCAPIDLCSLQQLEEIKHLTDHNFFAEQNRIPHSLQSEINQLFELVQDSTKNSNATENLQTCIATRRTILALQMTGQNAILSAIALSGDTKQAQISETQNQFELARQKLSEGIEPDTTNTLDGYDHLGMNLELLKKLGVTLNINSLEELNLFKTLSAEEIQSICVDPEIKKKIIAQIKDIGGLILFLMNMSSEKMTAFLDASRLLEHFIKNESHLALLLNILDIEKSKLIVDALKMQTPQLITNTETLISLGNTVTQEHFALILEAWDVFNWQIDSVKDVLALMQILPGHKERLYLKYKDLIENISDHTIFVKFMTILPEQYKALFYNRHKHLIENITDSYHINKNLKALPEAYRAMYIQAIMPRIPSMLTEHGVGITFEQILEFLTFEQRTAVFQTVKPALIANFKKYWRHSSSSSDLSFLKYLTEAQCIEFLKPLETIRFSSSFLMNAGNLGNTLYQLSEEKCRIVCKTWKQSIIKMLKSAADINVLFEKTSTQDTFSSMGATPERRLDLCPSLYDIFKDKIASTLQSDDEYNQLKQYLTPEEQLDLSHRITLYKLQPWLPSSRLETFKSALMYDETTIKVAFDALFKPKYTMKSLFSGNTQTNANLLQIIACAETGWLHAINTALSLELTDAQLTDKTAVKTALEHYVATTVDINHAPRI